MLTNFEKGRELQEQLNAITDPVEKRLARHYAKKYFDLDLKVSRQQLRQGKPHYAFGRVLAVVVTVLVAVLIVLVLIKNEFPNLSVWSVMLSAVALVFCGSLVAFFARGKLSEDGFLAGFRMIFDRKASTNRDTPAGEQNDSPDTN